MPTAKLAIELEDRPTGDEVDAYERLLTCHAGDSVLFVREDAVEALWVVVQQLLGNVAPAHGYEPGS